MDIYSGKQPCWTYLHVVLNQSLQCTYKRDHVMCILCILVCVLHTSTLDSLSHLRRLIRRLGLSSRTPETPHHQISTALDVSFLMVPAMYYYTCTCFFSTLRPSCQDLGQWKDIGVCTNTLSSSMGTVCEGNKWQLNHPQTELYTNVVLVAYTDAL